MTTAAVRAPPSRPGALLSTRFWRGFVTTSRPYLAFVSAAAGLLGLSVARPPLSHAAFVMAAVAFFFVYGLGQAITDVTQTDTDAISAPYRPLVRGEITPRLVTEVALVGLTGCALVFALLNPWTLIVSLVAVVGVATYTRFKRIWWAGPPWNAWIIATLTLIGAMGGGGGVFETVSRPRVVLAASSVFFTYAVFVLLGHLKDVEADRATGYDTVPVHFGRRPTVIVSGVFAALGTLASMLFVMQAAIVSPIGLVLWVLGLLLLALAHVRSWSVRRDEDAHTGIAISVSAFVAIHLGEAVIARPTLGLSAILIFVLSIVVLALRRSRAQI